MQQFTNIARLASDSRFRKESAVFVCLASISDSFAG